jgi:hypothetical protein
MKMYDINIKSNTRPHKEGAQWQEESKWFHTSVTILRKYHKKIYNYKQHYGKSSKKE